MSRHRRNRRGRIDLGTFFSTILLIPKIVMAIVFIGILIWLASCLFLKVPDIY